MSRKSLAAVISVIAFVVACVTALLIFRDKIEEFLKAARDASAPAPEFTPEEFEVFADI